MGPPKHQKVGIALAMVSCSSLVIINKKRRRKCWVKEYLLLRKKLSNMKIVNILEPSDFRNFLRLGSTQFEELLALITPYIKKEDTLLRESISARERLIVTLRFLATGNAYEDLKFSSLISAPLLTKIIPETCKAIYKCLSHYIRLPENEDEWENTARSFKNKWNFDNCVGAFDGKHVAIDKPPGSGSLYYNYKGFFSVVLFAVVNANYEFMYVHTGTNGSVADGAILKSTKFYEKLQNGSLNLPSACTLPNTQTTVPYVFLGDSAFGIERNIMKPFPFKGITYEQRIFNYRLSRARRVVENAFGILASRFRVLRRNLSVKIERVDYIVLACCVLHNFLRRKAPIYLSTKSVDRENTKTYTFHQGDWRQQIPDGLILSQRVNDNHHNAEGVAVRNKFVNYFNSEEGRVSFQDRMINVVPR